MELASQNERERLAVGCVAKEQRRRQQNHSTVNGWCSAARKQDEEESLTVCAAAVAAMLAVGEAMDSYHSDRWRASNSWNH